ncbi:MAG: redox-sensing transcriptional repressor Rex [Oscillospiraceae bacterium]|nr:redox-sensing transcriptional repressor Rex [Oscillospiraceae bacterium]
MEYKEVSETVLRRLPAYLHLLNSLRNKRSHVSASYIAAEFGLNDVQVRKDLAAVSGSGRPKTGYAVSELIGQLEACLGYRNKTSAILVGAGNLGRALLSYAGFSDYGLDLVAAFDSDPALVGTVAGGKPVLPMEDLEALCFEKRIRLGIITIPPDGAQAVCDRLVSCGIRAVWNFAPTILKAPAGVLIENENIAASLAILSKHLRESTGK